MSTCATYEFSVSLCDKKPIYIFIPVDGYPEGAAGYFLEMHKFKNFIGGFAGRFFRANDEAEFTSNHEAHKNTTFRYTLKNDGTLIAKEKTKEQSWEIIFNGKWYEFINKYINENLCSFKEFGHSVDGLIMTIEEAKKYIDNKFEYAKYIRTQAKMDKKDDISYALLAEQEARCIQSQINLNMR